MEIIRIVLGEPLGHVLRLCFAVTQNYGVAIILFALLARAIIFPISVLAQKNSVRMARLKPRVDEIKARYAGDKDRITDEQLSLYKKEKYNPVFGILPLLVQIPLILGLLSVMYDPLPHLGVAYIDLWFLGLDLSQVPRATDPSFLITVLSGTSAFLMCMTQNKFDVLQKLQSMSMKIGMTVITVAFSAYFAFIVPAGVGLYWTVGNLAAIPVIIFLNHRFTVVDMGRHTQKSARPTDNKALRAREKADRARFFDTPDKSLVFYSQASGFYKYFSGIIDYVTAHSNILVHYVTSDPSDKIFNSPNKKIIPYYIGDNALISFMMEMDADMVVMTMPDLGLFHIKRSFVRKDIEYVFLDHGMTSFHLMYREGALNHYDTIFAYGPNHIEEVRETERVYNLPAKKIISTGYGLLDEMLEKVAQLPDIQREIKQILVAPSWQADNIMELCLDEVIEQLAEKEFTLIIRPHPEFIKRFPDKMRVITEKYKARFNDNFVLQTDFSSNETVFLSDLVITDWSSIAQEFSYATKKPSLFINTPTKIMNPAYQRISCIPLDISLRDEIGISINLWELDTLYDRTCHLLAHRDAYHEKITEILHRNIFHIGQSNRIAGDYIINALTVRTIGRIFKCDPAEITDIRDLKKGMTNRSFIFTRKNKTYIMRMPGIGTDMLINRHNEFQAYKIILPLNISDDVIYLDPHNGYKVTVYWENAQACDPMASGQVRACMKKLREFHELKLTLPHTFDIFERILYYENLWVGLSVYADYAQTKENVLSLKPYINDLSIEHTLTHIDAVPDNFLFIENESGEKDVRLIDWEYASMADPHVDIAMFAVYSMYDKPDVDRLIDSYFTEGCPDSVRTKIYAYIAMSGLLWSNWCEYKGQNGAVFGEYAVKQYNFARDYYRYFLDGCDA